MNDLWKSVANAICHWVILLISNLLFGLLGMWIVWGIELYVYLSVFDIGIALFNTNSEISDELPMEQYLKCVTYNILMISTVKILTIVIMYCGKSWLNFICAIGLLIIAEHTSRLMMSKMGGIKVFNKVIRAGLIQR